MLITGRLPDVRREFWYPGWGGARLRRGGGDGDGRAVPASSGSGYGPAGRCPRAPPGIDGIARAAASPTASLGRCALCVCSGPQECGVVTVGW
nr:hypothetical protein KitaXyl93_74750 [Kitasatospora sp. Xyl93]